MDQLIKEKKFNKYQFLKRTLQLVFSVSVFSLFVWHCSGFSFNPYFSMLPHSLQRKYMFLICNAILAFLAKTSLFTSSSPPISSFDFDFQPSNLSQTTTETPVSEETVLVFPLMTEEELQQVKRQEEQVSEADEGEEQGALLLLNETKGRENEAFIAEGEEVMDQDTTEDDELADTTTATNEELANTDELNRKFEEFIRKMKEEMRIQAQRQTIAV